MPRSRLWPALAALLLGAAAPAPSDPIAALDGRLVRLDRGRLAPARIAPSDQLVAFYFGAGWCAPCRAFVPDLKRAYPRLRSMGIEVVFVSDDRDCRRMADYIRSARMPWPAIGCRDRDRFAALARVRGAALPGLLVYDRTGNLRATSWQSNGTSAPRQTLAQIETMRR